VRATSGVCTGVFVAIGSQNDYNRPRRLRISGKGGQPDRAWNSQCVFRTNRCGIPVRSRRKRGYLARTKPLQSFHWQKLEAAARGISRQSHHSNEEIVVPKLRVASKWVFLSLTAVALVASTVAANAAGAADKAPMRIAAIDPTSGMFAAIGDWSIENLKFNSGIINQEGGVDGHKIEIVPLDNAMSTQKTLVQFHKAVNEGIRYIAQNNGDPAAFAILNAAKQYNERNPKDPVMFLNYGAINDKFTNQDCNFYSFLFDATISMKMNALTNWIEKQKNIHKIFLFNQDYVFGHDVAKTAREMLAKKRPDIKIVGDTFIPLATVQDFTPYVTQIKASGADAVITGNWGTDMSLFVKAAAQAGLDIPLLTYYGGTVGTVSAVGQAGVNRIYEAWGWDSDLTPEQGALEEKMYKTTHYDNSDIRSIYMFNLLKEAGDKAHSINPTKIAFALENMHFKGPVGDVWMRGDDHQIQMPIVISVMQDNMKYGLEGTHFGFHGIDTIQAAETSLPTSCKMKRPANS
jgi:branched-chain amino acid transport system substrate-binding protein